MCTSAQEFSCRLTGDSQRPCDEWNETAARYLAAASHNEVLSSDSNRMTTRDENEENTNPRARVGIFFPSQLSLPVCERGAVASKGNS
jgi:hypothetical protein